MPVNSTSSLASPDDNTRTAAVDLLPIELWASIVECAAKSTVLNLSVISKEMRKIALPFLFRHTTIQRRHLGFDRADAAKAHASVEEQLRFISSSDIAHGIRSFEVVEHTARAGVPSLISAFAPHLNNFINLHSCTLFNVVFDSDTFLAFSKIIWRSLTLESCSYTPSDSPSNAMIPTRLSVSDLTINGFHDWSFRPLQFALALKHDDRVHSVTLGSTCFILPYRVSEEHAYDVFASVTCLTLETSKCQALNNLELLQHCRGLKTLTVVDRSGQPRGAEWVRWFSKLDLSYLGSFTGPFELAPHIVKGRSITSLCLEIMVGTAWAYSEIDFAAVLHPLDRSLLELTIRVPKIVSTRSLQTAFAQISSSCPCLRILRIEAVPVQLPLEAPSQTQPSIQLTAVCLGTGPLPPDLESLHVDTEFIFDMDYKWDAARTLLDGLKPYRSLGYVALQGRCSGRDRVCVSPADGTYKM